MTMRGSHVRLLNEIAHGAMLKYKGIPAVWKWVWDKGLLDEVIIYPYTYLTPVRGYSLSDKGRTWLSHAIVQHTKHGTLTQVLR